MPDPELEERVLLLGATRADGERIANALRDAEFSCEVCDTLDDFCRELKKGAGALLVVEDVVVHDDAGCLLDALAQQPEWSSVPLVVIASERFVRNDTATRLLNLAANVTLLERPLRMPALSGVLGGALRARRRQYDIRDALAEREQAAAEIARLNRDLQQRLAEMETLLNVIPVGIGIGLDRECRNIRVNSAFARLLGLPPDANASKTAAEPERPTNFRCFDGQGNEIADDQLPMQVAAREGRAVQGVELDVVRDDGHTVRLWESAVPLFTEQGESRGSVGAFVDITDRTRIEAQHRFLVELDDAVRPLTDPEDITRTYARLLGEHLGVNRCAYASVEADEDTFDLTGDYNSGVASIVGRYTFTQFGKEVLRLMRAGEPYVVHDIDAHEPPPEDFSAYRLTSIQAVICVPLKKQDRFVAAMAVHQKVPRRWTEDEVDLVRSIANRCWESIERARVERAVRQSEAALREADRRKDQFLATLAHELRNPLAPLSNALQIWPLVEKDPGKLEGLRELMGRQVQQMIRLIDDLLDVSRISRGRVELRKQRLDLSAVIESAVESVQPFIDACRHELTVVVPQEPLFLTGDVGRLVQVFGNLLHNAAKYTVKNGHVWITVRREGDEASVSVRDTGVGIPAEMLTGVFDMFTQVDQTLDRSQGGLGIGLTLVKSLVELHGGRVQALSDGPGKGSEFVVRLPVEKAPVETADTPQAFSLRTSMSLPSHRILVVDDVRASADTLAMMLQALGQDTRVEYDGPGALQAASSFKPDVVFLDIAMPGMDGYEVARVMRADPDLQSAVLVALTGYGQKEDRRRAFEAGFNHHLVKPTRADALRQLLAAV